MNSITNTAVNRPIVLLFMRGCNYNTIAFDERKLYHFRSPNTKAKAPFSGAFAFGMGERVNYRSPVYDGLSMKGKGSVARQRGRASYRP